MYIKSPMENYNKNNPFIIIAKKVYDSIIDNIHLFGKQCVASFATIFIIWICLSVSELIDMLYNDTIEGYIFGSVIILSTLLLNIGTIIYYRKTIRYFISTSPAIQEFSRLSKLEVNDIIALNNEELLKCVYGLYELRGELAASIKYHRIYIITYSCAQMIFILTNSCAQIIFILANLF